MKRPDGRGEVVNEPHVKFPKLPSENTCSYKRLPPMCVLGSAFYLLCLWGTQVQGVL